MGEQYTIIIVDLAVIYFYLITFLVLLYFLLILELYAVYVASRLKGHAIRDEAQKLMSDGLESKLFSTLEELLSRNYPEQMVCLGFWF